MNPAKGVAFINPAISESTKDDPNICRERLHLSSIHFLLNSMERMSKTYKDYKCPFLAIQGGIDKLVHPMGVFELFKESPLPEEHKDLIFIE